MDTTSERSGTPDAEIAWTPRQREVLDLIARGKTNQEVADTLGISLDGAKWHMREILSKLNVDSREEAAEYWRRRNGWRGRWLSRVGGLGFASSTLARGAGLAALAGIGVIVVLFALGTDDSQDGGTDPPPGGQTPEDAAAEAAGATPTEPGCSEEARIRFGVIGGALTMTSFVRLNDRTYEANPNVGSLDSGDLGPVVGEVLLTPNPRGNACFRFVEGASVGLVKGTELRQVGSYDPAFRIGADVGGVLRLFERTSTESAATGADLFDIEGRVETVVLRSYENGQPVAWQTGDPDVIALLVDGILAAEVAEPQSNGYGVSVLELTLHDGSRVMRAYERRANYLDAGIMLPASFAQAVESMQPIANP
ncbi:MAG: helix-turn-helix transcriptional regulator [Dehalococcoidia bacterium]